MDWLNTLAYYGSALISAVKSFIVQPQVTQPCSPRMESQNETNWPPLLGQMDKGICWRIPPQDMNATYLTNARAYYSPTYFYDGKDPYPEFYMHGAGYFLPWWSLPCIYQQNFQVKSGIDTVRFARRFGSPISPPKHQ